MNEQELKSIQENVRMLLLKYPKLRVPYKRKNAIWKYWEEYDGGSVLINEEQFVRFTNPETISRAIRKVLSTKEFRNLPNNESRYKEAEVYRNFYGNKNKNTTARLGLGTDLER